MAALSLPDGVQLRAFAASTRFARAIVGPIYGGRKVTACHEIIRQSRTPQGLRQRVWRWVVVGPVRDEVERGALATVRAWLPPAAVWDPKSHSLGLDYDPGDGVARTLTVIFLGWDSAPDRARFHTIEATGVWLDNARWLPEPVFDQALAVAQRGYPPAIEGGSVWNGVICTSRMPDPGHWLISRSQERDGVWPDLELFRQPGGRSPEAENLSHLRRLGFDYHDLAERWPPDRVRVEIDAELGANAAETALEADRAACRESFLRYIGVVAPDIIPAEHHRLLIATLERVARGELKRVMFFLPPGSAKSTYASVLFPPWYMGRNPKHDVILGSHARDLAERFGRRGRNTVSSGPYQDIFGFGLSPDSGASGRWANARGGEFYAVGVDGSVTGRRADLGIIDDPVKGRAEADSPQVRQHTWDWYLSDFWTRLKPEGAIIYIGTRWHDDDLAGRLLQEMKNGGEQWEVISLPALAKENDPLGRKPGERLWADWFTADMFAQAQRDPRNWSALYQQEPMPESGAYFKSEWIRYYDEAPPRRQMKTYGASDYAVKEAGGDFTVHLVVGIDPNDDLYVLDLWREQASSDVWVEAVIDRMKWWETDAWAEERGQIEKGVGPFLQKRMLERKVYRFRKQFSSATDKPTRAQAIRGRMAMGKVYLPKKAPWIAEFINELLRFPAGTHDDVVDAFGLIGRMLDEFVPGTKPQPREELRTMQHLTFDEAFELCAPGKRYGHPLLGGGRRI